MLDGLLVRFQVTKVGIAGWSRWCRIDRYRPYDPFPVTTIDEDRQDVQPGRQMVAIVLALLIAVPALFLRFATPNLPHPVEALLFGLAIVGAAFLLSWAAEVAQLDISAGLAIALLALIAVLPEYAVDLVFAKEGGQAFAKYGVQCQSTVDKLAGRESPC